MDIEHMTTSEGEEWVCGKDDDLRLVCVLRADDEIQVSVGAAEFVREEALESRMRTAVMNAITSVEGVEEAYEEDREVWTVEDDASGEALLRAVASAIDAMYAELSTHVESLG